MSQDRHDSREFSIVIRCKCERNMHKKNKKILQAIKKKFDDSDRLICGLTVLSRIRAYVSAIYNGESPRFACMS